MSIFWLVFQDLVSIAWNVVGTTFGNKFLRSNVCYYDASYVLELRIHLCVEHEDCSRCDDGGKTSSEH